MWLAKAPQPSPGESVGPGKFYGLVLTSSDHQQCPPVTVPQRAQTLSHAPPSRNDLTYLAMLLLGFLCITDTKMVGNGC